MSPAGPGKSARIPLSHFGRRLADPSGIYQLMEDLGRALAEPGRIVAMLGGGNPAHLPAVEALWRRRLTEIMADPGGLEALLGDYDTPRGQPAFLATVAAALNEHFGWDLTADQVAVTTGSQTASFLLFNLLAGPGPDGFRRILFPIIPEYIGYAGAALDPAMFAAWEPHLELVGDRAFKYRMRPRPLAADIAAICLSRPTNPSANVITDAELAHLADLAANRDVFLIVDNAYGQPFPGVIFSPVTLPFHERIIHLFSLSKIGLPGTRTAIVVACPEIIRRLAVMNANLALATPRLGQAIARPLIASGELFQLSREVVRPFYQARSAAALATLHAALPPELPWRIHVAEGAFFLWLWLPGLPIASRQLYERLKARGIVVVPGAYFSPAGAEPSEHIDHCLRISYCAPAEAFAAGAATLADELRQLARQRPAPV